MNLAQKRSEKIDFKGQESNEHAQTECNFTTSYWPIAFLWGTIKQCVILAMTQKFFKVSLSFFPKSPTPMLNFQVAALLHENPEILCFQHTGFLQTSISTTIQDSRVTSHLSVSCVGTVPNDWTNKITCYSVANSSRK